MSDLNPVVIGSTRPAIAVSWVRPDKSVPDLTAAALSVRIAADSGTPAAFTGTGTFTGTSLTNGQFTYKFSVADFTAMGTVALGGTPFHIQFVADYGGGDDEISLPVQIIVMARL